MEKFFNDTFINEPLENFKTIDIKEIGIELDWFSHVYGRTILVGTLTYESYKNYRCKKEFESKVLSNPLNIPTVIFIHDWDVANKGSIEKFKNPEKLFNGCLDEISNIENKFVFCIKRPKLKKNGKSEKHFNIQRKKRFRINVVNGMCSDKRIIHSTTISCTFRNLQ